MPPPDGQRDLEERIVDTICLPRHSSRHVNPNLSCPEYVQPEKEDPESDREGVRLSADRHQRHYVNLSFWHN